MSISEAEQQNSQGDVRKDAQEGLRSSIPEADVIIILLTKGTFANVVAPIWDEMVQAAMPDTIWGLGLPQSAINSVDIESLRQKADLYVYYRTGVARLGTETRDQLLSAVRDRG